MNVNDKRNCFLFISVTFSDGSINPAFPPCASLDKGIIISTMPWRLCVGYVFYKSND